MERIRVLWLLALLLALPSFGAEKKLRVITSFLPVYCFTASITGDAAQLENLLPGNVSLHDYQLSPGDLRKIAGADLIIVNGLGMESFLERAMAHAAKATVVTLTDGLGAELIPVDPTARRAGASAHDDDFNPHTWLDPVLAAHGITNILHALEKADPLQASVYRRNAAEYIRKLQNLNLELAEKLQPIRQTGFVTYHSAFNYFVRRYQLKLVGVVEQVPENSPSPRELSALLAAIRSSNAKALFAEPGGSSRLARQIARDTGLQLGELDPLETGILKPDAYEKGMLQNAEALLKALR